MAGLTVKKWFPTILVAVLFCALAVAVSYPALRHMNWWGGHDWVQFYTYYGVPHRAVTQFHQLPAWNPYFYGGNVQWGHPDDPTLSPLFVLMLLFGVVPGVKVALVLVLAGGMYSMWLLARHMGFTQPSSFFAAAVWGLNGWHAYHFAVGHCDHFTFLFEPLAVYFFLRGLDDRRWGVAVAAVLAFTYFSGGPYPLVFAVILLSVLALILTGQRNSSSPLLTALFSFLFAAGFMAVKALATVWFMLSAESVYADRSGTGIGILYRALFDSSLPMFDAYGGTRYGAWEYAAFIGYIPAIAFVLGALLTLRRNWPWLVIGVIFLVTSFGSASPVNFFSVFTVLPGLSGMHVPFRFIVHFILAVCIVGAAGLDALAARISKVPHARLGSLCSLFVAAAAAANLVWMHYDRPVPLYRLASSFLPQEYAQAAPEKDSFPDLSREDLKYLAVTYPQALEVYESFLESRRLSWGYDATRLPCAAHFPGDDAYRGEVYLADAAAGSAALVGSTLSTYRVSYAATKDATLMLNQNYAPGWRVTGTNAHVYAREGLVAVDVSAGQGTLEFSYDPKCFLPGLAISVLAVIVAFVFVTRRRAAGNPS